LDTSKLRDAPDGEAAHALNGKMRRAMEKPEKVDVRQSAHDTYSTGEMPLSPLPV